MKKRSLKNKKIRLVSVGLLASSAVLSVTDAQPIVAKEKDNHATKGTKEHEEVPILSSTKDSGTTESSIEESTTASESTTSSTTESSTVDSSSSTSTSDSSSSESTSDSSTSTSSSTSSSSTSTSSSSSSTSSSTSSSSSSTSSSKPKPQPSNPSTNKPATSVAQPPAASYNTHKPGTVSVAKGTGTSTSSSSNQVFHVSPNLTTKSFVKEIGEDARSIAGGNDLYASVMIAQAILESASGNSALASSPNYNLFGIKGSYQGASANFLTSEDNGSGSMFTIRSDFRKYPSYKESLEDYVKLIKGGTDHNNSFYSGVWKTNASSYKDATKYLTGRYATDTSYNAKLNGLIDAYDLTQYDSPKENASTKKAKKITLNTAFDHIEKQDDAKDKKIETMTHIVKKGESLKSISELYNISTLAILEKNQLDRRMLFIGQKLNIPQEEAQKTVVIKEEAVDRSLDMAQKLSSAFTKKETTKTESKTTKNQTKDSSDYQVSAIRKKTSQTYEVKKGDTLASISKKTGVSILSLKEWNDLDQYFLTEGQLLVLSPTYDLQS